MSKLSDNGDQPAWYRLHYLIIRGMAENSQSRFINHS